MKFNLKTIFLLLTIAVGIIFTIPHLNYQDALSQGDHGRDLYAFEQVWHGKLPYKDFWWVYGPLMPYYYGLFYKIFGVHISSVLIGKMLIEVLCGAFFYLTLANFVAPGLAFLGASWFIESRLEFFFTYNHIGGILASLIISYCLFSYIRTLSMRFLWPALITAFVFTMVKINFGIAGLVAILLSVFIIDRVKRNPMDADKKKFYLIGGIAIPVAVLFIYWLLLKDLPMYAIRQCMPYFGDDQPYHVSPMLATTYYMQQHWLTLYHSWLNFNHVLEMNQPGPMGIFMMVMQTLSLLTHPILHLATIIAIYLLITKKVDGEQRTNLLLALMVVGMCFVFYFQEFIVSGIWYRTYWSFPFLVLFHFLMISIAFSLVPKIGRIIVKVILWVLIIFGCVALWGMTAQQKIPPHYLSMDRGHIYVGNEPEWTDTVNSVTAFLQNTLSKDELFFALPYDCLYYYLTGKESPTRQLIFFNHIKIPLEQEVSIIQELENKHVNYILMSNRVASSETGNGVFGKTYCPLIAQYIQNNFKPLTRKGGNWQAEPGWANNHGVIIFKRKTAEDLVTPPKTETTKLPHP